MFFRSDTKKNKQLHSSLNMRPQLRCRLGREIVNLTYQEDDGDVQGKCNACVC